MIPISLPTNPNLIAAVCCTLMLAVLAGFGLAFTAFNRFIGSRPVRAEPPTHLHFYGGAPAPVPAALPVPGAPPSHPVPPEDLSQTVRGAFGELVEPVRYGTAWRHLPGGLVAEPGDRIIRKPFNTERMIIIGGWPEEGEDASPIAPPPGNAWADATANDDPPEMIADARTMTYSQMETKWKIGRSKIARLKRMYTQPTQEKDHVRQDSA